MMTDSEYNELNASVPAALPKGLSPKAVEKATMNITLILGIVVLAVILGTFLSTWFDKQVSEAVIAMGSVALGYLGRLVTEDGKTSSN